MVSIDVSLEDGWVNAVVVVDASLKDGWVNAVVVVVGGSPEDMPRCDVKR